MKNPACLPPRTLIFILCLGIGFAAKAEESGHDHHGHHDHAVHQDNHAHHVDEAHGGSETLHGAADEDAINWLTGEGADVGGFLFPELFVNGVFGDSTADPADLAVSDHDPQDEAALQSLHLSAFLQLGDRISGFANYEGSTGPGGDYSGLLEEGFLHFEIINGVTIGGGQFLNSFGFQNERHVHAWDFVDQYLANGRLLNEGELAAIGGELILDLPTPWRSKLTLGGGGPVSHAHGEGEAEHGHGHGEAEFDPDGANFDAWVLSGNYRADYGTAEQAMAGTASFAVGENGFGEITQIYGVGHEILWLPSRPHNPKAVVESTPGHRGFNGFEAGSLRWRTEAIFRSLDAISEGEDEHHEDEHEGDEEGDHHEEEGGRHASFDEFGAYTMVQYGLCDWANAAFRAEWVSGIDEMGLDERWRLSPALTAYLNDRRSVQARLQYNYDHGDRFGSEHSVWLQIGVLWGVAPGHHGHEH